VTIPNESPAVVAMGCDPATTVGPLELDAAAFVRMLEDDAEIGVLLQAVRDRHTMDLGGPGMSSLTRALGAVEALRIELRLCFRYMTGGAT
jgi:hypothetical protein